ncbi:MAG TPA: DUF992 domain-containing protein [Caulobacteraceae bacterium]|jgi:hypothetical protein|nr:DUF992 domain-containing protein [Caulobacteraceae bacterium]
MKRNLMLGLAAATSLAFAASAHADTPGVKAGVLTCNVASGWGLIFGSSKDLNCTYQSATGHEEHYAGTINKFGVDVGYHNGGVIVWAVVAPTAELAPGALTGDYGGVTAGASAVVGAGANALVGGNNRTISLQPVSIEGMTGVNVAAGVASISLAVK